MFVKTALVCAILVAYAVADTINGVPIDNVIITAKKNELTCKFPAKNNITLVIVHLSLSSELKVPDGGQFDTPIMTTSVDGYFTHTEAVKDVEDFAGKRIYSWVRLEITNNGKKDGYNSEVRYVDIPQ